MNDVALELHFAAGAGTRYSTAIGRRLGMSSARQHRRHADRRPKA